MEAVWSGRCEQGEQRGQSSKPSDHWWKGHHKEAIFTPTGALAFRVKKL